MPESIFEIAQLVTTEDVEAVMFELQDLPCVNHAEVDLIKRQACVSHTSMISTEDIAAALEDAGYGSKLLEG
jgi:cation transport ATPase